MNSKISVRGKKSLTAWIATIIVFALLTVVFFGIAIWSSFRSVEIQKYYKETEATISRIEIYWDSEDEEYDHYTYVDYTVDNVEYTNRKLDYYTSTFREGDTITILYDTRNPSNITHPSSNITLQIACFVIGGIFACILIFTVVKFIKNKNSLQNFPPDDEHHDMNNPTEILNNTNFPNIDFQ